MIKMLPILAAAGGLFVTSVLADSWSFRSADIDGDGKLTMDDAMGMRPGLMAEEFYNADADGDGLLAADEMDGLPFGGSD